MTNFWETAFAEKDLMWGTGPTESAKFAGEHFSHQGVRTVLIPGIGYGRNAAPFLDRGMSVSGIEVSETAIQLAKTRLRLEIPIYLGSVTDMPFDTKEYDGIFCYGLIYLLDAGGRRKLVEDCSRQLAPGGHMLFTVISKKAPMFGQGKPLGVDCFERHPGLPMFFYDSDSVEREFGPFGLVEQREVEEPMHTGESFPFIQAICCRS